MIRNWLPEDYGAIRTAATKPGEALIKVLMVMSLFVIFAGCASGNSQSGDFDPQEHDLFGKPTLQSPLNTYSTHNSNNYFSGTGFASLEPIRVDISTIAEHPEWVAVHQASGGEIIWGVIGSDGYPTTFEVSGGNVSTPKRADYPLDQLVSPPTLREAKTGENGVKLAVSVVENSPELRAMLSRLRNLPDASTVLDEKSTMYSYSDPTDRYPHGALGDKVEWGGLAAGLIDGIRQPDRFRLGEDEVFEGLFPIVADVDGDGSTEIVTTVSRTGDGARLVVIDYSDEEFKVIAESDPVGTGFRWLHQIAVAPFGPNGEIEIGVVQTPHVGGIAKFYRINGDRLELAASKSGGYMSHVNGSRNLDQAVAADFDRDGAIELIVPSRDQERLIALRRVDDQIEEVWEIDLGARLSTNLTVLMTANNSLILGAATEDGALHIWQ